MFFKFKLENDKLKKTNNIWNKYRFNSVKRIGSLSKIIKQKKFNSKEEWISYYYKSGEKLKSKAIKNKSDFYNHGRTRVDIFKIGIEFYQRLKSHGFTDISLADAIYLTEYRILHETYNGIIGNEQLAKNKLLTDFKGLVEVKEAGSEIDNRYAVDLEVFSKNGYLLCGIQVKPTSYLMSMKIKKQYYHIMNENKNKKYKEKVGKDVLYLYVKNYKIYRKTYEILYKKLTNILFEQKLDEY